MSYWSALLELFGLAWWKIKPLGTKIKKLPIPKDGIKHTNKTPRN